MLVPKEESLPTHEEVSSVITQIAGTNDTVQLRGLARQLVPLLIDFWDVHSHSAMEWLESATIALPLPLSHATVRQIVTAWKRNPSYDPAAGGNADHCYLSALILSENFDLADQPWADSVLPRTLDKELNYPRFERMRDGAVREALVRALAKSRRC